MDQKNIFISKMEIILEKVDSLVMIYILAANTARNKLRLNKDASWSPLAVVINQSELFSDPIFEEILKCMKKEEKNEIVRILEADILRISIMISSSCRKPLSKLLF